MAPLHPAQPSPPWFPLWHPYPRRSWTPGHRGTSRDPSGLCYMWVLTHVHLRKLYMPRTWWCLSPLLPGPSHITSTSLLLHPPQVIAYNRDSFNITQQRLVLLTGNPEGTISLTPPPLHQCPSWGIPLREGRLGSSGEQGILEGLWSCILSCSADSPWGCGPVIETGCRVQVFGACDEWDVQEEGRSPRGYGKTLGWGEASKDP